MLFSFAGRRQVPRPPRILLTDVFASLVIFFLSIFFLSYFSCLCARYVEWSPKDSPGVGLSPARESEQVRGMMSAKRELRCSFDSAR